jgi:hypothetical protein
MKNVPAPLGWKMASRAALTMALRKIQDQVQDYSVQAAPSASSLNPPLGAESIAGTPIYPETALERLCQMFKLSGFERSVLLLCAAVELIPPLSQQLLLILDQNSPTFGLAATLFAEADWDTYAPNAPLRRWQLIEMGKGTLMTAPLQINERILHYLMGNGQLDQPLDRSLKPVLPSGLLGESHQTIVQTIVTAWQQPSAQELPLIQLCEGDPTSQQAIAAAVCQVLGWPLYALSSAAIPTTAPELERWLQLWEREAVLNSSVLLVQWQAGLETNTAQAGAIARGVAAIRSPLMVVSPVRQSWSDRSVLSIEVPPLTVAEQTNLWELCLGAPPDPQIPQIVSQFNLSAHAIQTIAAQSLTQPSHPNTLWNLCRQHARPRLDDLSQCIKLLWSKYRNAEKCLIL